MFFYVQKSLFARRTYALRSSI